MYICYLDESGNVEREGTTPYFVLLGVAIPARNWKAKDREVRAVKSLAKNYRKTDPYIHLTHAERVAALRDAADTVGRWGDATVLADAQRKAAHPPTAPDHRILDHAFEQVITRYHHLLERLSIDVGIVVQDQNETAAKRLTGAARRYHREGTKYAAIDRIVETPLFVNSELTLMVQVADLCAYATRRFFENGEDDLFDRIYPAFDRVGGKLVGLRHYTGKNQCKCRVCVDHGR